MFQSEHSSPSGPRGASSRSAPSIGAHQLLIKAVEGSVRRDQMKLQYPMTHAAISVGFTQTPRVGGIDQVMIFFHGTMGTCEFDQDMPCSQIGRTSCRERWCQYVLIWEGSSTIKP